MFLLLHILLLRILRLSLFRILVFPHLIDAEFRKAWMPFFCRSGPPVVTPDQFLDLVGHLLPQEPQFDLPKISGRDLQEVARAKKPTAGGLAGWAWNEMVWLFCLSWLRLLVCGLRVYWMPKKPRSRKLMVIQPHLVRGPFVSSRLCTGCGPPFGLVIFGSQFLVWVMVSLHLKLGLPLPWTLRRFSPGLVGVSCTSWSLMLLSHLTLLTGPYWIVLWVDWACLTGLEGPTFLIIVRLRFKLAAGLGEPWCRDGGIPQGCPLSVVLLVAFFVPWCSHLETLPDVKPQLFADNLKCSAERPGALLGSARFTARYVRSVGQDVSPGKCVLLSTSKSVRKAMKLWDVSGGCGLWKVQLDVRDLGGHLDFSVRARAGTISKRIREATLGVASVGAFTFRFSG